MSRFLWLSLIFCVCVSLLWWPGARNQESIFELIERERAWQTEHLGFDLVDAVDQSLISIQNFIFQSPIPTGDRSTLRRSTGAVDHEIEGAVHRVSQEPYFQAMFALIVLAIGRVLVTSLLALMMIPILGSVVVDAMCAREIRHVKFLPSDSFQFRIAITAIFILIEVMFILSLVPVWIDPFWILGGFLLMSFSLHRLITHYYK